MSKWQPIETAPKDGTWFIGRQTYADTHTGVLKYRKWRTQWGKTSHVPLYGWCRHYPPTSQDFDLWTPTHWMPLPPPPVTP
jgi:hypothetical protein